MEANEEEEESGQMSSRWIPEAGRKGRPLPSDETTPQQATLPVLAHVATVFVSCLEIPSTANLGSNTLAYVTNNISLCLCGREMKSVQTNIATATTAEQENLRSARPIRERKIDGDRFICFTAPSSSTDIVLLSLLLLVNV